LPGRAREVDANGVVGQTLTAPSTRDLVAEGGADRAIDVLDGPAQLHRPSALDGLATRRDKRGLVERTREPVVLRPHASAGGLPGPGAAVEGRRQGARRRPP